MNLGVNICDSDSEKALKGERWRCLLDRGAEFVGGPDLGRREVVEVLTSTNPAFGMLIALAVDHGR